MSNRNLSKSLQESLNNLKNVIGNTNEFKKIVSKTNNEVIDSWMREAEIREKILKSNTENLGLLKRQKQILKNISSASKEISQSRKNLVEKQKVLNQLDKVRMKEAKKGNTSLAKAMEEEIQRRRVSVELEKVQQASLVNGLPVVGKLIGKLGRGAMFWAKMIDLTLSFASILKKLVLAPFKLLGNLIKDAWSNFLEIQTRTGNIAADLGLSNKQAIDLRQNFAGLALQAGRFGADMAFVEETMRKMSDITNRNVIFTTDDMNVIADIAKSTGLGGDNTASLLGNLQLINMSIRDSGSFIEDVRKRTTRMNLNVTKNLSKISDLFDDIKGLSFKGGLDSLSKLVAKAESLRFNLKGISGLADQLMTPEGSIQLASSLRVLGGSYAGLADPMRLMYLAQSDQAKLFDEIIDATTTMSTITKDGLIQISPKQRMILSEVAKLTGQSADELMNAALQGGKLRQLITQGGLQLFTKEDQMALLNMAEFKDGKYYLTMDDGTRRTVESMRNDKKLFKDILDNKKILENAALGRLNIVKRFDLIKQQLSLALDPFFRNVDTLLSDTGLMNSLNNSINTFAQFTQRYFMKYFAKGSPIYTFLFNMGDKIEGAFTSFERAINLAESQGKSILDMIKDSFLSLGRDLVVASAPYFRAGFTILMNELNKTGLLGWAINDRSLERNLNDPTVKGTLDAIKYPTKINDGVYNSGLMVSAPKGTYQLDKADQFIAGTNLFGGNNTPSTLNLNISGELLVKSTDASVKLGESELKSIGVKALATMVADQIEKNKQGTYKENRNGALVKSI